MNIVLYCNARHCTVGAISLERRQYWPGSRAERPIPSSAPCGGGGMGTPSVYWQAGGGDLHI